MRAVGNRWEEGMVPSPPLVRTALPSASASIILMKVGFMIRNTNYTKLISYNRFEYICDLPPENISQSLIKIELLCAPDSATILL